MSPEQTGGSGVPRAEKQTKEKKPVLIYIMVLLAVAFILMGLSLLMHQRTNTKALGELRESVSAMQEMQASQEKIIELQDALSKKEQELEALIDEKTAAEARDADALAAQAAETESARRSAEALLSLYNLQQQWLLQRYDDCSAILKDMADRGLVELLPSESPRVGVTAPAMRYRQFEEALARIQHPEEPTEP